MIYFGDSAAANTWPHFILNHMLGDWGAACFLMMVGMSQVLSANRRVDDPLPPFRKALIRGGYLFLVGLLMLALSWGPAKIWQWDILTLMGTMTVVVFFCRRLPSWLILALCLLVAVATPWMRAGIDYGAVWGGPLVEVPVISTYLPGILVDPTSVFQVVWTLKDVLLGFVFTGYFPLLPWALFPLLGVVLGRRLVRDRVRNELPFLAIIGGLFVCLGLGGAYASRFRPGSSAIVDLIAPLCIFPDSFTMIQFQMGMALLVFSGLYYFLDVRAQNPAGGGPLVRISIRTSRFSLTFYFVHYLMIGWPMAAVALFTGRQHVTSLMGDLPALATGVAGLVLLEALLFQWEKRGGRWSLEWLLGALASRLGRRERAS
jgi:Heparan-alpha-glucosaminide N-acetyltransferase, catalytic